MTIPESERAVRRGGFLTLVYRRSVRENVVVFATRLDRVFVVVIVVFVVAVFADFGPDCIFTNTPLSFETVFVESYESQK